jgi:hypothetical protein
MSKKLSYSELIKLVEVSEELILGVDIFTQSKGKLQNVDIIDLSNLVKRLKDWSTLLNETKAEFFQVINNYEGKEHCIYEVVFLDIESFESNLSQENK